MSKKEKPVDVVMTAPAVRTSYELLSILQNLEWPWKQRRCGVCFGWDPSPNGNGETDFHHTKDCGYVKLHAAVKELIEAHVEHDRLQDEVLKLVVPLGRTNYRGLRHDHPSRVALLAAMKRKNTAIRAFLKKVKT